MEIQYFVFFKQWFCMFQTIILLGYMILISTNKFHRIRNGHMSHVSDLAMKLVSQGFSLAALRKKFVKFYQSKLTVWCKFGVDIYKRLIKLFL